MLVRLLIHGQVQGVGFRAYVRHTATKLGLDGYVRNRTDGTVEAVFFGDAANVEKMIAFCNEGPPAAKVERVEVEAATIRPDKGFRLRETV